MTIELRNISKTYQTTHGKSSILTDVNLKIGPGEHVGILGQNGAGKSTLIRILGGSEQPTSGHVRKDMVVSWPLAFGGAFLGGLTGADNVRFVCRLYGVDPDQQMPFIEEFTELGKYLREPVRTYSSGMRARLAFGVSMAIEFDCYLIDEIVAVGDDRFQRKCQFELFEKRRDRAMLIVSHSADFVRQHCQRASVLSAGRLTNFPTVDEAYAFYASHEMPIQPHMAGSTNPKPHLRTDILEFLSSKYAQLGPGAGFEMALQQTAIDRVPVFDSCDVVGRLAASGHTSAAVCIAEYLTNKVPEEPLFWVTLGDLWCRRRQHVKGVAAYHRALLADPTSYWALRNLATEYFNVGLYENAVPHFSKALDVAHHDSARVELQTRIVDCHFLLDREAELHPKFSLSPGNFHVEDREGSVVSNNGAARLSVAGLWAGKPLDGPLRCIFKIGDDQIEGARTFARNSIRRLASVADYEAICFTAYPIVSGNISHFDIEIWQGGKKIYESTQPLHFIDRPVDVLSGDPIAVARHADKRHDCELSIIFYGVAERAGLECDIVRYAESLIACGLYHEAEYRLHEWVRTAHADASDWGFVIDLLSSEIARSRLPGWQERIDKILRTAPIERISGNRHANEGHKSVACGDLPAALASYERASRELANGPLIHFARGIHTAPFAGLVPPPSIDDPRGDINFKEGFVHLFACDGEYFTRYGRKLIESSIAARQEGALRVHAHIVDPTDAAQNLADQLRQSEYVLVTYENSPEFIQDDAVRRAYYTCARFLQAPRLLEEYQQRILITETDCLMNWTWPDLEAYVGTADLGYLQSALWNWVPWTKVPAGIYMIAPTLAGRAISDYIARFIECAFQQAGSGKADVWTVDQVALWLAHMNASANCQTMHLPMSSVLTLATGDKLNI